MKLRSAFGLVLVTLCASFVTSQAQVGGGGQSPGVNSVLAKLFGKATAFSAKAQMRQLDASGKETMKAPVDFAFLNGSVYWSMDIAKVESAQIPENAKQSMISMGMNEMITITKADGKTILLIYPGLQSYLEMPVAEAEVEASKADVSFKQIGEETVNGYKCKKNKVIIKSGTKTHEATTWNVAELKDFPVRVEMQDQGHTVQMNYSDVKLTKPDAKLFKAPAGFTRYATMQDMMKGVMLKKFGAAPK